MRRALLVAAAVAAVAAPAGATAANSPTPAQFQAVQTQVKALQKQVKTLTATVTTLKTHESEVEQLTAATFLFDICEGALTADLVQGTWAVVDQLSSAVQAGKVYFGPQTPIDDTIQGKPVCQLLGIARSQAVPPTAAPFSALYALLRSSPLFRATPYFAYLTW
jgi:hypothetical protein